MYLTVLFFDSFFHLLIVSISRPFHSLSHHSFIFIPASLPSNLLFHLSYIFFPFYNFYRIYLFTYLFTHSPLPPAFLRSHHRGHAFQRRLMEREQEKEMDTRDRVKEKEELEELRNKILSEGHDNPDAAFQKVREG